LLIRVSAQKFRELQVPLAEVRQPRVRLARPVALVVPHQRHLELQHGLGRTPANLLILAAEQFAQQQERLGGALGDHVAARGAEELAIGRGVVARELHQLVLVDLHLPCHTGPGLPSGPQFGSAAENRVLVGAEGVHGSPHYWYINTLCISVHIMDGHAAAVKGNSATK
jgi:hypothetical protein